jgi:hypothetical protein
MSTDDAKTYLSKREIPRLFEVRNTKYVPKIAPDCLCFLKPQQNTLCFEFIVLTWSLKNTIIVLSQHKTMMLQVTFYTNCQSFRLYLNNGNQISTKRGNVLTHSWGENLLFSVCRALWRPTALAKNNNDARRQRNLGLCSTEIKLSPLLRYNLKLWQFV